MTPETAPAEAMTWMQQLTTPLITYGYAIAIKLIGAALVWFFGRMAIRMLKSMLARSLTTQHLDETLTRYIDSAVGVLLNVLLILAILSVFGIETTTFAGLLAAAGVAIGMAWSGLLANFAAGAFMVVLRPFKVGDFVQAGGVTGTVMEVGLFVTVITTMDNVTTIVGNNTIFSGNISNYSDLPARRVDLVAQLSHDVDPHEAIEKLQAALAKIPNVSADMGPDVYILEFNLAGPVLCVRPYTHTDHYWQVYFDTNMAIRDTFGSAGYSVPEKHYRVKGLQGV